MFVCICMHMHMCVSIYKCALFCSECCMHFETGVVGTSAWVGRQAAKLNIQSEFKRFKTKENIKKVMANSATSHYFLAHVNRQNQRQFYLLKWLKSTQTLLNFLKFQRCRCARYTGVFSTPTYTSANTLSAGCAHMCICIYMCICMHMYMDANVRL